MHVGFSSYKVIKGNSIGRKIGYPTANLQVFDKDKLNPKLIYLFAISGVIAILFSMSRCSEIDAKFIKNLSFYFYKRNIAIKTKTDITATVPHRTNFVKLFQVFLWFSLSIKIIFVLL